MLVILCVVTPVTIMAEVGALQKPTEGIASVVMVIHFDKQYLLISWWSGKYYHVRFIHSQYFYLVIWKGLLKAVQFWNSTLSLGYLG